MVRVKNGFFVKKGDNGLSKTALAAKLANFFEMSCFFGYMKKKYSTTIFYSQTLLEKYGVSRFFLLVKFATSLLASLAGG